MCAPLADTYDRAGVIDPLYTDVVVLGGKNACDSSGMLRRSSAIANPVPWLTNMAEVKILVTQAVAGDSGIDHIDLVRWGHVVIRVHRVLAVRDVVRSARVIRPRRG